MLWSRLASIILLEVTLWMLYCGRTRSNSMISFGSCRCSRSNRCCIIVVVLRVASLGREETTVCHLWFSLIYIIVWMWTIPLCRQHLWGFRILDTRYELPTTLVYCCFIAIDHAIASLNLLLTQGIHLDVWGGGCSIICNPSVLANLSAFAYRS